MISNVHKDRKMALSRIQYDTKDIATEDFSEERLRKTVEKD